MRFARYPGESAQIIFAPLMLARDRGYFADEGVEVEIIEPEDHPWQSVARGETAAGVAYIDYGARPEYYGAFKAVAVQERLSNGRGLPALLARPELLDDGTLGDESGLRGRKIGLNWGRGDDYLTYLYPLMRAGLTIKDVTLVAVPHEGEERDRALKAREIDVIIGRRPRACSAEESRGVLRRWLVAAEIEEDWQNRFIIFNADYIKRNRDAVRAFLRAHQRGVDAYIEGTRSGTPSDAFLPELARLSMESPELLRTSAPGGFPANPAIDMASLARDIALMAEAGLYPNDVPVDDLVDLELVS